MKQFLAIVVQTIRSAIRSKVFHVLFVLILLAVVFLPLTVAGDGTAVSLVQISITFSLGVVVALISATALWLSCSQLSSEIEKYSIHLVVAKPCPKWIVWMGKWAGIFVMHALILIVSAIVIFILIQVRVSYGDFSEKEISKLDSEVRVGRVAFSAVPEDFSKEIAAELEKHRDNPNVDIDAFKSELKRQFAARKGEVQAGKFKEWVFPNIKTDKDKLYLHFRLYSGSEKDTDQQMMYFTWKIKDPTSNAADAFIELFQDGKGDGKYHSAKGGSVHEWEIDAKYIDKRTNTVTLQFFNMNHQVENFGEASARSAEQEAAPDETPEQRDERIRKAKAKIDKSKIAVLQPADGPFLLIAETSFGINYVMAIVQALLQIAFLAALGCTVSAAFSTPVAAFVAVAYLLIGLTVQAAIDAPLTDSYGRYMYKNAAEKGAHVLAQAVDVVVVSVDDFDATGSLARGTKVENKRVVKVFRNMARHFDSSFVIYTFGSLVLLLRWVLVFGLGIWIFQKRELGSVIRK